MTNLADLLGEANDPVYQVPATLPGVGKQSFPQKQASFAKKGCLPATKEAVSSHGW